MVKVAGAWRNGNLEVRGDVLHVQILFQSGNKSVVTDGMERFWCLGDKKDKQK